MLTVSSSHIDNLKNGIGGISAAVTDSVLHLVVPKGATDFCVGGTDVTECCSFSCHTRLDQLEDVAAQVRHWRVGGFIVGRVSNYNTSAILPHMVKMHAYINMHTCKRKRWH